MTLAEQLSYVLGLLKEDNAEAQAEWQDLPSFPKLSRLLSSTLLPPGSLLLGQAGDGLPVALDLLDPTPGALLILGDAGSGKTSFLRVAANSAARTFPSNRLKFAVITPEPESWQSWRNVPHFISAVSVEAAEVKHLLFDLQKWAQGGKKEQSRLLLIDDLSLLASLRGEWLDSLRWILESGPYYGLWSLVTLNASLSAELMPWVKIFSTRIVGYIEEEETAAALAGAERLQASSLLAGAQFMLRAPEGWMKFWLPTPD